MSAASRLSRPSWLALAFALGSTPSAALAQQAPAASTPAEEPTEQDPEEIVVVGTRPRGSVEGDFKPERTLDPAEIQSLGAKDVGEVIAALTERIAPPGSPPPVTLLNGRRISSPMEIATIPPQAIARTEILPAEAALAYGYPAEQKVLNIVLVEFYNAIGVNAGGGLATRGGWNNAYGSIFNQVIARDNRLNITVFLDGSARLRENQRNITPIPSTPQYAIGGNIYGLPGAAEIDPSLSALAGRTVTSAAVPAGAATGAPALATFLPGANAPAISDVGTFRTLSPWQRSIAANVTFTRTFGLIATTVNGRLQHSRIQALQGLPNLSLAIPSGNPFSPFGQPVRLYRILDDIEGLSQRSRDIRGNLGLTLASGLAGDWRWTFTGTYGYNNSHQKIVRGIDAGAIDALQDAIDAGDPGVNPFGPFAPDALTRQLDAGLNRSHDMQGNILLNGPLVAVPAGKAALAATALYSMNDQSSRSVQAGATTNSGYRSDTVGGQANVNVPLASRTGFLREIGNLSVNANVAVSRNSDFGLRTNHGYGLNWTPMPEITLLASQATTETPPMPNQLVGAVILVPNVPVFDYRTGSTVFVTRINGANPDLRFSRRNVVTLNATLRPLTKRPWSLTANYSQTSIVDPVSPFPPQSPAIEAAFPDRFLRDARGTLLSIDARPTNFARSRQTVLNMRLSMGFNIGRTPPPPPPPPPPPKPAPGAPSATTQQALGAVYQAMPPPPPGAIMIMGPGARPRLQIDLSDNWTLTDTVQVRPGLPVIDNLNGGTTSGRGTPKHRIQANANLTWNGVGLATDIVWTAPTRADGALGGNSTLRFAAQTNVNLRFFAALGSMPKLTAKHPFLKSVFLNLNVQNLFDSHQRVTDATRATPIQYERDRINPVGRTISIGLNKQF